MRLKSIIKHMIVHKTFDDLENMEQFWSLYRNCLDGKKGLTRYRLKRYGEFYGCSIPCAPNIEKFCTPHMLYGIFISQGAKIGTGCTIYHGVTIGSNTLAQSKGVGAPTIGRNCFIGAGAMIIGNCKIGDNVRIGANCIVTENVPDNATVVSPKPIYILHDEPRDNTFLMWDEFIGATLDNRE